MALILGSGMLRFEPVENWEQLPDGWSFIDVAGVAVDSKEPAVEHWAKLKNAGNRGNADIKVYADIKVQAAPNTHIIDVVITGTNSSKTMMDANDRGLAASDAETAKIKQYDAWEFRRDEGVHFHPYAIDVQGRLARGASSDPRSQEGCR